MLQSERPLYAHLLWLLTLCLLLLPGYAGNLRAQTTDSKLNLDFESRMSNGYPRHWYTIGSPYYRVYMDSSIVQNGKYALRIESNDQAIKKFKTLVRKLPLNYKGKEITLSAYIKTENVQDGFVSPMIRLDPGVDYKVLTEDPVKGTTGWTKYQISLPLQCDKTKAIAVGAVFVGSGKMWIDNLQVRIDGRDAGSIQQEPFPADLDTEFDDGSSLPMGSVDVPNLALLGKVWGFLKYYHPYIAKGQVNWDYALLRFLPKYTRVKSEAERDAVLLEWIQQLGSVDTVERQAMETEMEVILRPDHAWIERDIATQALKDKLHFIYKNRDQSYNHYYVETGQSSKPQFTHERTFSGTPFPTREIRLLALFRFWNIVHYFFPYKALMDRSWDPVLFDYIPNFLECRNELDYELTMARVISELSDSHAGLWGGSNKITAARGYHFPPLQVRFIEGKLVVTNIYPQYASGSIALSIGDRITAINGKPVEAITDSLKQFMSATREIVQLRDIAKEILRSPRPQLRLSFLHDGLPMYSTLDLIRLRGRNIVSMYNGGAEEPVFKKLSESTGYVNAAALSFEDIPGLLDTIRNTKGIIIDLRFGKQFEMQDLVPYFAQQPREFVRTSHFNRKNIGEFLLTKTAEFLPKKSPYRGKVIVLINENTQSSLEWTTMAFSACPSVTLVGSNTAGADGNMTRFDLPGGMSTAFSGIGVYNPDGGVIQRVGISPDILVRPTIEDIRAGKDEVLERGVEVLKDQI